MFEMIDSTVPVLVGTLAAAVAHDHPRTNCATATSKQRGRV